MVTTIGSLFDVVYGQKEYHNKEWLDGNEGKNILVSSKGEDNGLYGFFDIKNKFKAPIITVQGYGTIGHAFVQEFDCSVDDHMLILTPKQKMSIEQLYQIAFQIRLTKWKYRYGRGITPNRLKKEKIKLIDSKMNYLNFTKTIKPQEIKKEKVIEKRGIKLVKLIDLCSIEKKSGLPINAIELDGNVPYVSSSSKDNGVVVFTYEEPNFKGKSLTVAKDGNDGYSFFQLFDFMTSIHNYVLTPKNSYPPYLLFYIGAVIKKRCYCYNHYYPLSKKHLEKLEIPMPLNDKGKLDLEYIEKIIKNCYGYNEIKKYL
jgi:hypothetical protein